MKVALRQRRREARCPYCHDAVRAAGVRCRCGATLHRDCQRLLRRCPTIGCAGDVRPLRTAPPPEPSVPDRICEGKVVFVVLMVVVNGGFALLRLLLG